MIIGVMGPKLGPWGQFEMFTNWPIWAKARFSRISQWPNEKGHSSVNFGPIDPIFLQMEVKTFIYVVQGHFGAKLFILVPYLKREEPRLFLLEVS